MPRRSFITVCGAVCGTAMFTVACSPFPYVTGRLDGGAIIVSRKEFAGREGVLVEHPAIAFPIWVHRSGDEEFTAVLTRCMHRGCTVEPADSHLVCPCHGSEYSNSGAVLKGPTELPLIKFPVRSDAENVYVLETDRGMR